MLLEVAIEALDNGESVLSCSIAGDTQDGPYLRTLVTDFLRQPVSIVTPFERAKREFGLAPS